MRASPRFLCPLLAAVLLGAQACDDDDDLVDGNLPGAGPIRLLVATRSPAALELFDAETLDPVLDTPLGLDDAPLEARAGAEGELFVTTFAPPADARAFDVVLFEEEPEPELGPGTRVAFEDGDRIYLAGDRLAVFDARTLAPLFPDVALAGEATDVVHDEQTDRLFVAVTGDRALLQVFAAANLSEVPPSPLELGDAGSTTGDLLLVDARGQVFVAIPSDERLRVVDRATLQELPRTPIDLRVPAASLARDPVREIVYAATPDGRLDGVNATDFSPAGGFPREVADSASDLAYEEDNQRLVVADSAAESLVVLDGTTLGEEEGSPVSLEGQPVSVEAVNLRGR